VTDLLVGFSDLPTPLQFDALSELSGSYLVLENENGWAIIRSGEGRMIDSVVWAQYINVTDAHTDSHVAIANAAPAHCIQWQKRKVCFTVVTDTPRQEQIFLSNFYFLFRSPGEYGIGLVSITSQR